jgi:hypothetical protein
MRVGDGGYGGLRLDLEATRQTLLDRSMSFRLSRWPTGTSVLCCAAIGRPRLRNTAFVRLPTTFQIRRGEEGKKRKEKKRKGERNAASRGLDRPLPARHTVRRGNGYHYMCGIDELFRTASKLAGCTRYRFRDRREGGRKKLLVLCRDTTFPWWDLLHGRNPETAWSVQQTDAVRLRM